MQVDLNVFKEAVATFLAHPSLPSDAEKRYDQLKTTDPYPEVPAALLHAGHVASYLAAVGIVDPFDPGLLTKPATYLVPLEGLVRYVDQNGKPQRFFLSKEPHPEELDVRPYVTVESNAVCYVTLKPTFRFPAYIAARFNLLIRDVYRGLLVGTGPLVDPGFVGRLSIPIHNFTSTEYTLEAGEGFVYFEFTKLSWRPAASAKAAVPSWVPPLIEAQPPFPADKTERQNLDDYIRSATRDGGTPRNAVVSQMVAVKRTSDSVRRRNNYITLGSGIAALLFVAGLVAAIIGAWQIHSSAQQFVSSANTELRNDSANLKGELASTQGRFAASEEQISTVEREMSELVERFEKLSDSVNALRHQGATDSQGPPYEKLSPPGGRPNP